MSILKSIELIHQADGHNKFYKIILSKDNQYEVMTYWGKIKTYGDLMCKYAGDSLEEAEKIFDKTLKSKLRKGYLLAKLDGLEVRKYDQKV
jgi:predicted DNA-binding WGR domain protein